MANRPQNVLDTVNGSQPSRPHRELAGQTTVNVPESIITSVDTVLDALGMPEAGPVIHRLTPRNVADVLGVPTPDQISDEVMRELDNRFDVRFPPER